MKDIRMICAGFGGQGVMSLGMIFTYAGMLENKQVTWCPSYGPEMRGGSANCSVTISNEEIGSPLISNDATIVVIMNRASMKFIKNLRSGGYVFLNSSLISDEIEREDITVYRIPVNDIATDLGNMKLANIVMIGAINHILKVVELNSIQEAFRKVFGIEKEKFMPQNKLAILKGEEYSQRLIKEMV